MKNKAYDALVALGVVHPEAMEHYCDSVRDRADIAVKRCRRSGVIVLDSSAQADVEHYQHKGDDSASVSTAEGEVTVGELEDTERRAAQFADIIRGRHWLDFGTGRGQILDRLRGVAKSVSGLEPNQLHRANIAGRGHRVETSLESFAPKSFDIATMFHVLEHLEDPVGVLEALKLKLVSGGRIIIEVPHARDALLELYGNEAFKRFTLWSEHLVLHTRESLRAVVEASGLVCEAVLGCQRYPVSNHLHWLRFGAPGGHHKWQFLNTPDLTAAYAASLAALDMTDTIVAYATVP